MASDLTVRRAPLWFLLCLLLGTLFVVRGVAPALEWVDARGWREVDATVVSSGIRHRENSSRWTPAVTYAYEVENTRYTGDRMTLGGPAWRRQRGALLVEKEMQERYPVGGRVRVWVDPENPARSVRERRMDEAALVPAIFGAMLIGAGIVGLTKRRQAAGGPAAW